MKEQRKEGKLPFKKTTLSSFERGIVTAMCLSQEDLEKEKTRANRLTQPLEDEVRAQVMSTIGFGWHIMKIRIKSNCVYVVFRDLFSDNQLVQKYSPKVITTWQKEDKPITKDSKYYQRGEDL